MLFRHLRIANRGLVQSGVVATVPVWLMTRWVQRENSAATSGHTMRPWGSTRETGGGVERGERNNVRFLLRALDVPDLR